MKKKFICTVCGYIHEGTEAPEQCPICKADKSKFKEMEVTDGELKFATVHYLGAAYKEGVSEELIQHCKETFAGECSEVGMYLAKATLRLPVPMNIMLMKRLTTQAVMQNC